MFTHFGTNGSILVGFGGVCVPEWNNSLLFETVNLKEKRKLQFVL